MKNEFIGFYDPTETEIENSWENGVFAFDANMLLNLYRYTESTRSDFIESLKTLKDRLFIPHQAAYEFLNNRLIVIQKSEAAYDSINDILKENYSKVLEKQINQFKKHPAINVDTIKKLHNDFLEKVSKELLKQKKNHPDFSNTDDILSEITNLFDNNLGEKYSEAELNKIYEEGKKRYANKIPPGFKDLEDKKNKGDNHIYGDLIIWKQLIDKINKQKTPIIFITDDRKEDWWRIESGKTIRPHEELIKEFFDETGIRILIYNADNFLRFAKERNLIPTLKDETVNEIKEIRVSDEKSLNNNIQLWTKSNLNKKWLEQQKENRRKIIELTKAFNNVKQYNWWDNFENEQKLETEDKNDSSDL